MNEQTEKVYTEINKALEKAGMKKSYAEQVIVGLAERVTNFFEFEFVEDVSEFSFDICKGCEDDSTLFVNNPRGGDIEIDLNTGEAIRENEYRDDYSCQDW